MACRLVGAKPLSESVLEYCLLDICEQNFNLNSNVFIQENAFENIVCKMSAILSRRQCVINHINSAAHFGTLEQIIHFRSQLCACGGIGVASNRPISQLPKCTCMMLHQKKDVHIFVLNGALWDMEQMHFGICVLGQFWAIVWKQSMHAHPYRSPSQRTFHWSANA